MKTLLGKNAEIIKNVLESDKVIEAIKSANNRYHFCLVFNNESGCYEQKEKDLCVNFLKDLIVKVKNNAEYFAMSFEHDVADETVVYQSLHQTYLEMMQLLYYNISVINTDSKKKYFTNAISLYNKWQERSLQDEKEEKEHNDYLIEKNKGTRLY